MTDPGEQQPPPVPKGRQQAADDAVATVIPYRNPNALLAYYLGLFSILPFLGALLGAVAFVCGILGLRHARREQESHGRVHAAIGIGCGGLFFLINSAMIVGVVYFTLIEPPE